MQIKLMIIVQWIKGGKWKYTVVKVIFIICEVILLQVYCDKLKLILKLKSTTINIKHGARVDKWKLKERQNMFNSCKDEEKKIGQNFSKEHMEQKHSKMI